MAEIEYFYSAHSAFAYLGSGRLQEIAAAAGRRIRHRPFDLTVLMQRIGAPGFTDRSPQYRAYFFGREIVRWAEQRGAPVTGGIPAGHRSDMTLPNGMLIAAQKRGLDVDALAHALLQAHWRDNVDITLADSLERLVRQLGLDPVPLLAAARSEEVLAGYRANTEEAIERSVFGSPTYFVDGDMFYGQDRLEMVERALHTPYSRAC